MLRNPEGFQLRRKMKMHPVTEFPIIMNIRHQFIGCPGQHPKACTLSFFTSRTGRFDDLKKPRQKLHLTVFRPDVLGDFLCPALDRAMLISTSYWYKTPVLADPMRVGAGVAQHALRLDVSHFGTALRTLDRIFLVARIQRPFHFG